MIFLRQTLVQLAAFWLAILPCSAESLLKVPPLQGDVQSTRWTFLASQNPNRFPDDFPAMKGTLSVALPGYGAGLGLYSWTGAYSITVQQPVAAAPAFDIRQVVFQLDATWDPTTTFPVSGGPKLSFNGGNQQIPASLPMVIDGTRVVLNETGVPEMEGIDSFSYRGISWQWDLTGYVEDIRTVSISMPFANHTSVVGAQIDVASQFSDISSSLTPLEEWRQLHFGDPADSGDGADGEDPDHDGIPNLIEYTLGTNPKLSGDGLQFLPAAVVSVGRLALAFSLPVTVPEEVICRVQVSDRLSEWRTLAVKAGSGPWTWSGEGASRITQSAEVGGRIPVTVADDTVGAPLRMMRLEVTR